MDADGRTDPAQLPRTVGALATADVALGSRWVDGGAVDGWPLHRRMLSQGGSAYARFALRLSQRDVTGGYRAFRAAALLRIDPASVHSQGYSFQIEMLWRAAKAGLDIAEVPITFVERVHGASKMSSRIIIEAMLRVTGWGFRCRLVRQLMGFVAVGALGFVVDIGVFNLLRLTVFSPDHVHGGPIIAKAVSVTLAIAVNWLGTGTGPSATAVAPIGFGRRSNSCSRARLAELVALACLGVSHYVLGLRSPLADNISANVIGLALGSTLRFVAYSLVGVRRPQAVEGHGDSADIHPLKGE